MSNEQIEKLLKLLEEQNEKIAKLEQQMKPKKKKPRKVKEPKRDGMQVVEPFRSLSDIEKLKNYFRESGNNRNELLFTFGINTNLRVSDLLKVTVGDVRYHTHLQVYEQKTGKRRNIFINEAIHSILNDYIKDKPDEEYLFKSREGSNKPLSRQMVELMISRAAEACGITYKVGTHSMRKTWGYHRWKNGTHIAVIQQAYNHKDLATTYIYLGVTQDDLDDAYRKTL